MKEPIWIPKSTVFAIHEKQLQVYGGTQGLRDEPLLESALARPLNLFAYYEVSICELAGRYAYGIIKNHPFVDGNKRTGLVTSILFLRINGYNLHAVPEEKIETILSVAEGNMSEEKLIEWIEAHIYQKESLK